MPSGGIFYGPSVIGNTFNPNLADTGWHVIKYIYSDGNSCSDSTLIDLRVNPSPTSAFVALDNCEYDSISFVNISVVTSGNLVNFFWDFGDGNYSNLLNPKHIYNAYGIYVSSLIALSDSGCSNEYSDTTIIFEAPNAVFSTDSVCEGTYTHFNSQSTISTGSIINYEYVISSGDTLKQAFDSLIFLNYGSFIADLIVQSDEGCFDTTSKSTMVFENPVANFTSNNSCENDLVNFNDISIINTDVVSSWVWNLSTGIISNNNPTSLAYSNYGNYPVFLNVTTTQGCSDSIKKNIIIHSNPNSNFSINNVCEYDSAILINNSNVSTGSLVSYLWDFGNSTTSNNFQDTIKYVSAGNYDIQLIVQSDSGCIDTSLQTVSIYEQPTANFACLNDTVFFQDLSIINSSFIQFWNWNYGNGVNTSQNFWHLYDSIGTYPVTLQIETSEGCFDSILRQVSIFAVPELDISIDNVCIQDSLNILNNSFIEDSSLLFWTWNFDDATPVSHDFLPFHIYSIPDPYTIQISALTINGCFADTFIAISSYPLPISFFEVENLCLNDAYTIFKDLSAVDTAAIINWNWNFGDGNSSNIQNVTNNYQVAGNYTVNLEVESNFGCRDTFSAFVDIFEPPLIWFEPDLDKICPNECVTLSSDLTTFQSDSIFILSWSYNGELFGENEESPTICLSESENYDIELIVITKHQCSDTLMRTGLIQVSPGPISGFTIFPEVTTILDPEISFSDTSIGGNSWFWTFEEDAHSMAQNPAYSYNDTGAYEVSQIVYNSFGCSDTVYTTVVIGGAHTVYVPNAFTPDSDGNNEVFNVYGIGILRTNFELSIFNRWGDLIYVTSDLNKGWDGLYKNRLMQSDVYIYKIDFKNIFNKKHRIHGHFTLVK